MKIKTIFTAAACFVLAGLALRSATAPADRIPADLRDAVGSSGVLEQLGEVAPREPRGVGL